MTGREALWEHVERAERLTEEFDAIMNRTPLQEKVGRTRVNAELAERAEELASVYEDIVHDWRRRAIRIRSWPSEVSE